MQAHTQNRISLLLDTGDIKSYEQALEVMVGCIALMSSEALEVPPACHFSYHHI